MDGRLRSYMRVSIMIVCARTCNKEKVLQKISQVPEKFTF